jgi:hypothetical protein
LGIGNALCGTKDTKELVTLTAKAAEKAEFLQDHRPGNDRENPEQEQNATGHRTSLCKDVTEIGNKNRRGQKNDATPQLEINFSDLRNVAHAYRVVKQMRCGR